MVLYQDFATLEYWLYTQNDMNSFLKYQLFHLSFYSISGFMEGTHQNFYEEEEKKKRLRQG